MAKKGVKKEEAKPKDAKAAAKARFMEMIQKKKKGKK